MPCLSSEHPLPRQRLQSAPENVGGNSPSDAMRIPRDNVQEEEPLAGIPAGEHSRVLTGAACPCMPPFSTAQSPPFHLSTACHPPFPSSPRSSQVSHEFPPFTPSLCAFSCCSLLPLSPPILGYRLCCKCQLPSLLDIQHHPTTLSCRVQADAAITSVLLGMSCSPGGRVGADFGSVKSQLNHWLL